MDLACIARVSLHVAPPLVNPSGAVGIEIYNLTESSEFVLNLQYAGTRKFKDEWAQKYDETALTINIVPGTAL